MSKRSFRVLTVVFSFALGLAPVGTAAAQGEAAGSGAVDRAALTEALEGHVESFEGGVLSLRYPFDHPSELDDFPAEGFDFQSLSIAGGKLVMRKPTDAEQGAFLRLGPISFKPPWSLRFKATPRFNDAGLVLGLVDVRSKRGRTWVLLNAPIGERRQERIFAAIRTVPGAAASPVAGPRAVPVVADKTVDVEITVKEGEMTVRYGGRRVLHDPFFTHEAFELIISPSASTIELDDVRVWGGAVAASLRKLVAGGKAADSDEAKRLEEGRTAGVAVVLARVDEPFSRAVRAEVRDLDGEARDLFVRARDSEGARSFSDAALLLQEASVIEPESAVILWRAGWNLQFSGDHRLSEKALRRAVEVDDEFAPAWRELGAVMSLLERDDEAIKAYDRALELDPEDAVTYALKGQVLQGRGQLDAALALYEEAQALKPRSEAWNLLVKGIRRLKTPPKWESSWTSSTEHFEVMTNVSDEFAQLVARRLEIYRSFLTRMIPPREGQVSPVSRVWIFDARREYNVFAGTMMSRTAEHTAGVYHPAIRTLLLFDDVDRDATFDTLYHEAFHQYLDKLNRTTPIWFNEGMAEFFGAVELDDTKVIGVGLHHERLTELRLALRDAPERIPDLDEIALMPKVDFYDRDEASLHYAVAWSLCHFFMTGRDSDATELFRLYSRAIFAGKSGEDAYAASFGAEGARPVDSFRSSWLRHVRRLR